MVASRERWRARSRCVVFDVRSRFAAPMERARRYEPSPQPVSGMPCEFLKKSPEVGLSRADAGRTRAMMREPQRMSNDRGWEAVAADRNAGGLTAMFGPPGTGS